jgi:hypothetical protein
VEGAGLTDVTITSLETATVFADFDDYWRPFLGGQGPAPGYAMALPEEKRTEIRDLLAQRLPRNQDGSIPLVARAWAIRGNEVGRVVDRGGAGRAEGRMAGCVP